MQKLSPKALAVSFAVTWSICMFFSGIASMFGWCVKFVDVMSSIYIGLNSTLIGSIIGAVWGFFDGAVGGAMIAFFYNLALKKK